MNNGKPTFANPKLYNPSLLLSCMRRRVNGKYDAVSLGLVLLLRVTRCLHKIYQKFCDLVVALIVVVSELSWKNMHK